MAAFYLLCDLCRRSPANFEVLVQLLTRYHHNQKDTLGKWDYVPILEPRAKEGFVGLRNACATCYMNSIIQQLFMHPIISNAIMSVGDELENDWIQKRDRALADKAESAKEGGAPAGTLPLAPVAPGSVATAPSKLRHSTFYEMQQIFGHLTDSSLQYCPTCQTGGKPLADRRMSRLLK